MLDDPRIIADQPLTIGTVMTPYPVVINLDTPLEEVAEQLSQNDITGAPVVDADGRLVGVIGQTDLVRTAAAGTIDGRGWVGFTARHVMTRTPVKAKADMPLADAVRRLERHGVHRLVIVADDDLTPIGIVSIERSPAAPGRRRRPLIGARRITGAGRAGTCSLRTPR